jgi:hypothetical protein
LGLAAADTIVPISNAGCVMGAVPAVAAAAKSDTWWRTADRGADGGVAGEGAADGSSDWGPEANNRLRRRPDVASGCVAAGSKRPSSSDSDDEGEDDGWQSARGTPRAVRRSQQCSSSAQEAGQRIFNVFLLPGRMSVPGKNNTMACVSILALLCCRGGLLAASSQLPPRSTATAMPPARFSPRRQSSPPAAWQRAWEYRRTASQPSPRLWMQH